VFSEALKTRTENRKKEKEKKGVLKDFQLDHRKQKTTNRKMILQGSKMYLLNNVICQ